jgi:hypothetical protein
MISTGSVGQAPLVPGVPKDNSRNGAMFALFAFPFRLTDRRAQTYPGFASVPAKQM